jgi:branched-subunit amino acid permease
MAKSSNRQMRVLLTVMILILGAIVAAPYYAAVLFTLWMAPGIEQWGDGKWPWWTAVSYVLAAVLVLLPPYALWRFRRKLFR